MKIVATSDTQLVLENRPRLLAGFTWFMGGLCVLAALSGQTDGLGETLLVLGLGLVICAVAYYFFPFQRLIFDRATGQITWTIARITGRRVTAIDLASVERAMVQAQWSDNTRMERVALVVNGDKRPLELGYSGSDRTEIVKAINAWLAAH